jgi:hypothetical protein
VALVVGRASIVFFFLNVSGVEWCVVVDADGLLGEDVVFSWVFVRIGVPYVIGVMDAGIPTGVVSTRFE